MYENSCLYIYIVYSGIFGVKIKKEKEKRAASGVGYCFGDLLVWKL